MMALVTPKINSSCVPTFKAVRIHLDEKSQSSSSINSSLVFHSYPDKHLITFTESVENSTSNQQHFFYKSSDTLHYKNASPCLSNNQAWCQIKNLENGQLTSKFKCGQDFYTMTLHEYQGMTLWEWKINGPVKKQYIKILIEDRLYLIEQLMNL